MDRTLPRFPLKRILVLRRRIELDSDILPPFKGQRFEGDVFRQCVERIATILKMFPIEDTQPEDTDLETPLSESQRIEPIIAVQNTLGYFIGRTVTVELVHEIAVRIAGASGSLKRGRSVNPDEEILIPAWHPLEILETEPRVELTKKGVSLVDFHFFVMAGPAAGIQFKQGIPRDFLHRFGAAIGLPKYKKYHYREFVRLWFMGWIESDRFGFRVKEQEVTSSMQLHNRNLYRVRGKKCLKGCTVLCHRCNIGYDQCPNGTHSKSVYSVRRSA